MRKYTKHIVKKTDNLLIPTMKVLGHRIERYLLTIVFVWFGMLKLFGQNSATSIIAKSIYWVDPSIMIPILGFWEVLIGFFLIFKWTLRFAVLLLIVRLLGTSLALCFYYDECFESFLWFPTIQGQYLIKDLTLFGAALVIGSTIEFEEHLEI